MASGLVVFGICLVGAVTVSAILFGHGLRDGLRAVVAPFVVPMGFVWVWPYLSEEARFWGLFAILLLYLIPASRLGRAAKAEQRCACWKRR